MVDREVYSDLKKFFESVEDVELPSSKGAQGLKYDGKIFAMFWKGELVLKLSTDRVGSLIAEGIGQPYDPGTGNPMKDRVLVSIDKKSKWIDLCLESLDYVRK